jgi:hypothetical protein
MHPKEVYVPDDFYKLQTRDDFLQFLSSVLQMLEEVGNTGCTLTEIQSAAKDCKKRDYILA